MPSPSTLHVIALFTAQPNKIQALETLLKKLIEPTHQEKGCIHYELHQNSSNPADFAFIEEWESDELLNQHLASAHVKALAENVGDLIVGAPDIRRYQRI